MLACSQKPSLMTITLNHAFKGVSETDSYITNYKNATNRINSDKLNAKQRVIIIVYNINTNMVQKVFQIVNFSRCILFVLMITSLDCRLDINN